MGVKHEIINRIASKIGAKNYLEIGVWDGTNFRLIDVNHKVGVDPTPKGSAGAAAATYTMTSSEFFNTQLQYAKNRFDIILVDGLHHSEQVYEDVINSLGFLSEGGYIVCHDISPANEGEQIVPQKRKGSWTGDCWKAWVNLRMERSDLDMCVINEDHGCGIIRVGRQETISIDGISKGEAAKLSYQDLNKNRQHWLNIVSSEDFFRRLEMRQDK
jgi:hypothetical protein